jgi:hypothetical protein
LYFIVRLRKRLDDEFAHLPDAASRRFLSRVGSMEVCAGVVQQNGYARPSPFPDFPSQVQEHRLDVIPHDGRAHRIAEDRLQRATMSISHKMVLSSSIISKGPKLPVRTGSTLE